MENEMEEECSTHRYMRNKYEVLVGKP